MMFFGSFLVLQSSLLVAVRSFQVYTNPTSRFVSTSSATRLARVHRLASSSNSDDDSSDKTTDTAKDTPETREKSLQSNGFFPSFLSRLTRPLGTAETENENKNGSTGAATSTTATSTSQSASSPPPAREALSPLEQAKQLKAQADRARLEAERMDAELTLEKIARLERELAHAKAKGSESVEDLQNQMDALNGKLSGETNRTSAPKKTTTSSSPSPSGSLPNDKSTTETSNGIYMSNLPAAVEEFDQEFFDETLSMLEETPDFLKKIVCAQLGFKYADDGSWNATEVALRMDEIRRFDFSFAESERPKFTQTQIDEMKQRLKSNWLTSEDAYVADPRLQMASSGNETELALMCLEYEYFNEKYMDNEQLMSSVLGDSQVIAELSSAIEQVSFDGLTEALFPPCTRKEDQMPTLAQAERVAKDILPKVQFTSTSKPLEVPGGFVIRGDSRASDGNALIDEIDQQLEKSSLKGKVTLCYLSDFTLGLNVNGASVSDIDDAISFDDVGGIIYVGGPDLTRESRKVLLSATTALGVGTCWYLSLYPFLLNPSIAKQVDEQLSLVEANMPADLSWLTDLSFPLFATFVGLQLFHEIGHRVAASFTGVSVRTCFFFLSIHPVALITLPSHPILIQIKPTFPTFVPSIITGVTSITTSFKEPPKNLQAMFDFSIAGPLFGMLGSVVAIFIGCQLSTSADPTNFPALPIEILMQSSLGGGVIESVLGPGVLNVPDAARGSQAIAAMTIRLHPVAVAGYLSLVVNALSMLPIGSKFM